jgi:outer membrane lipoprotein SlyB
MEALRMLRGKIKYFIPIFLVVAFLSCARQRPVLYPNAQLKHVGKSAAEADIDECIQLATDYGAKEDSGMKVAKDTGTGAAIGGAAGAAVGAVTGNLGRGAAAGAAGGGAAAITRSAINSGQPDPVFKKFVEQCLRDKGYQPIGWR